MDLDHLANVSAFGKQVVRQIVAITIPRSVSLCIGTYATRVKAGVSDEAARRLTWTVGVAQRVAAAVVARSVAAIARSVLCGRHQVVSRGDQPPLRACGGSASSLELIDAPVVLGLSEHGLDHRLASSVKPAAELAGEHGAHEGVATAVPAAAGCVALAGIGRDQDLGAHVHDLVDLLLMPVAAVSDRDPRRVAHTDLL